MKKLRILWIPILCAALLAACGSEEEAGKPIAYYQSFPSYSLVVKQFFRKHEDIFQQNTEESSGTQWTREWNFEKRPDGWWVSEIENRPEELKTLRSHQLWNAETQAFIQPEIPAHPEPDSAGSFRRFLTPEEVHHYTVYPFYGYASWAGDCIAQISPDSSLGDTLLYGLGRAYAVKALAGIGVRTDPFSPLNAAYDVAFDPASISDAQVNESLAQARESLRLLSKLQARNPSFVALVAPIDEKVAKDRMLFFQQFRLIGREKEAGEFLGDQLLTPFQEEFVRNLLSSVSPNGILIFDSEDEAWPFLWAQQKWKLRTDLSILSAGTLTQPRYLHYHSQLAPPAQRIPFTIQPQTWKQALGLSIDGASGETADLPALLAEFQKGEGASVKTGNGKHRFASVKELKWKLDANAVMRAFPGLRPDAEWKLGPEPINGFYLALLDLVSTNNWARPVEWPLASNLRFYGSLAPHLYPKGFTAQLMPLSHAVADMAHGPQQQPLLDTLRKNLNGRFAFTQKPDSLSHSYLDWMAVATCRMAHQELAAPLSRMSGSAESVTAVKQCLERIPPGLHPLNQNDFWMVMVTVMANDKPLTAEVIRHMKRGLITNPQTRKPEKLSGERLQYFEFLIQGARRINDPALVKELQLTLDAMREK